MKRWSKFSLVVTAIAVLTMFVAHTASANIQSADPQPLYGSTDKQGLHVFTNRARIEEGKKPLELDSLLNQSAQRKADEMARSGIYGHIGSDGRQGYSYIQEIDPSCVYAGENLAEHTRNSSYTVNMWLQSPAHKDALMNERYTRVGYGINGPIVVQHFCGVL